MAKLQRAITWSDFDHVAMIIKSEVIKDDIFLLEAVNTGVRIIRWSNIKEFVGKDNYFKQVCYRRVNMHRSKDIKLKLNSYFRLF